MGADLVSNRDNARKELFDSIDLFCQEVNLIPLQEREKSLQVMGNIKLVSCLFLASNMIPDKWELHSTCIKFYKFALLLLCTCIHVHVSLYMLFKDISLVCITTVLSLILYASSQRFLRRRNPATPPSPGRYDAACYEGLP